MLTGSDIDAAIDRLSAPFEGTVRAVRLEEAGIGHGAIQHRVETGRLIPMFEGVYLVGHRGLTERRVWWCCLMAGGVASGLSRRTSAEARALVRDPRPWAVSVAVPQTASVRELVGSVPWIDGRAVVLLLHRSSALSRAAVEPKFGHRLPMLSVPDTIVDVAGYSADDFDDLFRSAEYRRLTTDAAIRDVLKKGRTGAAAVRERLDERVFGSMRFENGFEELGEALFEVFGLGRPLVNFVIRAGGKRIRVDLYWPALGLVIELDGGGAYGSIGGNALDRENEALLRAAGLDVMRFDWNQIVHRPGEVRAALAGRGYLAAAA